MEEPFASHVPNPAEATGVPLEAVTENKPIRELIGLRNGKVDLSRFEQLMHHVAAQTAKKNNCPPHKLVRFIRNGKVQWTTAEQAKKMIRFHREQFISDQSDEVASAIEKALNGDIALLEDELLVLLCVAHTGFGDDPEAVKKFDRRHEEIVDITTEIKETETDLERRKRESGIINDFEEKMGLMMQARNHGDKAQAKRLADELKQMKQKYVLYSRSILPMISNIKAQRTDLMRTKEKLLSNMIQQMEQREQGLSINLSSLAQNAEKVEAVFLQLTQTDTPVDKDTVDKLRDRLHRLQEVMCESEDKLSVISCEKGALQQELKTTQAVIKEMDQSIDEDHSNDVIKKAQAPKIGTTPSTSSQTKKVSRMTRIH